MAYQFTFIVTGIETGKLRAPEGVKMNRKKSLVLQSNGYDPNFWNDPSNAKLVPLSTKQVKGLEKERPLEDQFKSKKTKPRKNEG